MSLHTRVLLLAGLLAAVLSLPAGANVRLPAIISDNMVLQRGAAVPVWGWADAGEKVTVRLGQQRVSTVTGQDERWQVTLKTGKAGGPLTMQITGKNTLTVKNILLGEVWLCSGQSNMATDVSGAKDSAQEIAAAQYPKIRFFKVAFTPMLTPQEDCEGRWVECSPETAASFSAVGYFFGRMLHRELQGVPVGLIQSAAGGTAAEPWTSQPALATLPQMENTIERIDAMRPKYGAVADDHTWHEAAFSDAAWKEMTLPQCWEQAKVNLDDHNGVLWFRKTIDIPAAWAGKQLALRFGPIDDGDITYFNGLKVGAMGLDTPNSWLTPRAYTVPGSLVKAGRAVIAVRVSDRLGNGGFTGGQESMSIAAAAVPQEAIVLAGTWKYAVAANWPKGPDATTLYNGMIAPLAPFALRGAIWYQGESNAGNAGLYRKLLPAMIGGWRQAWGQGDFPFLIVQLPNYMGVSAAPTESAWAELREAQALTAATVPNTGLAVTIDLGEAENIHPKNKQDVGARLALLALAKTYGQKREYTGPQYYRMTVEGKAIRLHFTHVGTGLLAKDGQPLTGFAIAGKDGKFVWATATIDGDSVLVSSAQIANPTAVRYAWGDNPVCNLYNTANLPAAPFRTDGK